MPASHSQFGIVKCMLVHGFSSAKISLLAISSKKSGIIHDN